MTPGDRPCTVPCAQDDSAEQAGILQEGHQLLSSLQSAVQRWRLQRLLSGPFDGGGAVISIQVACTALDQTLPDTLTVWHRCFCDTSLQACTKPVFGARSCHIALLCDDGLQSCLWSADGGAAVRGGGRGCHGLGQHARAHVHPLGRGPGACSVPPGSPGRCLQPLSHVPACGLLLTCTQPPEEIRSLSKYK